jgi:hypothetical protein
MSDLLQVLSMLALPATVLLVCRHFNRRDLPSTALRH